MPIILGNHQDAYTSAHMLLAMHGRDAERMALDLMLEFLRYNDIDRAGLWLSIANVIEELRSFRAQGILH